MPPETAREVFALYREYHGPLSIFSDGRSYLDGAGMALFQDRHIQRHSTEARQPDDGRTHVVRDLDEWMSRHAHEVEKFCMFFDSIEIAQAALVRFRAFPGIEAVQGAPDNVEVTAAGVDKGTALLALADWLGIPREATLAIGDSDNDRAMLVRAGVAAVMANALPEIRALGISSAPATMTTTALQSCLSGSDYDRWAFLCNVYKLLCKTLCLLSITKSGRVVYTNTVNVWWGECAHPALPRPECQIKRRNAL